MAEEAIYTLTEKSSQQVMDTVRTVDQLAPILQRTRAVPGRQVVGYWVEILSEEPDELMLWECLVLGAYYQDAVGLEEYILFDRDPEVRFKITDPNLLRREDE